MTQDTRSLLEQFVRHDSESAFRELVMRYTNLVYSVALRLGEGNAALAQDITQTVFIDLAKLACKLPDDVMLGGWLHRHTCFAAATILRTERRRRSRERIAVEMKEAESHSELRFADIAPSLDDAINRLEAEDRNAVISRFFEQADFHSVGKLLGVSEDAARMRVTRALEKLRVLLKGQGTTFSAAALGTVLAAEAVTAAPAGLATSFGAAAISSMTAGPGSASTLFKLLMMTKIKAGLLGAMVIGGVATPLAIHYQAQSKVRDRDAMLQQQTDELAELRAENARLSNLVTQASNSMTPEQSSELLRLRGEVGLLNQKLAAAKVQQERMKGEIQAKAQADTAEQQKQIGIAKMTYAKGWVLALWQYADQNQGQFPTNFDQAASFLPDAAKTDSGLTPDQFEITYQGSLNDITNRQSIIVVREKDAVQDADGSAHRAYGFADGHSEIHKAVDGNFQPWEQQHMIPPPLTAQNR